MKKRFDDGGVVFECVGRKQKSIVLCIEMPALGFG